MSLVKFVSYDAALYERVEAAAGRVEQDGVTTVVAIDPHGLADGAVAFAKQLVEDDPLVVALHVQDDPSAVFDVAVEIDRLRGDVGLVFFAQPSGDVMRNALKAGVRELLSPDADTDAIANALSAVQEIARRRRAEHRRDEPGNSHRTIAVLSPKGGAGKTMLATSLAVGLAHAHPRDVCLIDIDLQFGDVGNALRLVPENTIMHAVASGLVDATTLKLDLVSHPSGVFALCAPDDPGEADDITPAHVARATTLLGESFEYVIVDTDPGLGEHTLAAVDQATDLVFVCATDVASVRGLNKELLALDRIGMTHQERHFVLNRSDAKVGLSVEAISETVALSVDVFVPSSRSVPIAMNRGVSLLSCEEASPVTKPLWQLVRRFTAAPLPIDAPVRTSKFLRRH